MSSCNSIDLPNSPIEESSNEDEPPLKSFGKEMPQDVRGGCLDSFVFESYVLCRRNSVGKRGLAVLALYGDNNVFNNCNIGDWLVRNIFNFKK